MQKNATFSRVTSTATLPTADSVGAVITAQFQIPKYVLYGIILTLSILGNTAVVYIILRSRRKIRKTSYVLLVLNLAICDAITPTISIPFDWFFEEHDFSWTLGATLCKLLWPLQTMFSTSSALTLALICYDRYRAVVHPFKARRVTKTYIKVCISAIHFSSCLFIIPYVIVLDLTGDDCHEHWPSPISIYRKAYTLILFLVQYGIPLVLMIVLHSLALKTLCHQPRSLRAESALSNASQAIPRRLRAGSTVSNASQTSMQSKIAARKKVQNVHVTKMFVAVVMVFAISMFPNQVLWLWVDFGRGGENEHFAIISAVCRLFTYSNSVLNPIIYGFFSREFRSRKTAVRTTAMALSKPGTHTSGLNHTAPRAINGVGKTSSSKGSGYKDFQNHDLPSGTRSKEAIYSKEVPDTATGTKKAIHYKDSPDMASKQILSSSFLDGSIENNPVALKRHLQQKEAVQDSIKTLIENSPMTNNDVLSGQLCPVKKSQMEGMDGIFPISECALRHFDGIRESRC